jgi:hypothetical protein
MSVTTTADEKLESARDHVHQALTDLSAICIDQCWGHDEFRKEFRGEIQQAFFKLVEIRKMLSP